MNLVPCQKQIECEYENEYDKYKKEYDKLDPSSYAPACIYGIPKMHKFSSSDPFPELRLIVSSIE